MSIIEFVRLILRHIVVIILVPLLLAGLVILLTLKPNYEYSSQTILYTGLASGSSIEMDKKFNYFATNTAFDNLINIIKSRETQEEVAIRLLSLHLMLPEANPKIISAKHYNQLKSIVPESLYSYIAKNTQNTGNSTIIYSSDQLFPQEINRADYEQTVINLTNLMKSSNDNFVYHLLNYEDDIYSLKALSSITAQRISSSDLIKLSYTSNDPGICQHTLAIYNDVCIRNYKDIKENRSDAVVKYFENQLANASSKLKDAEDKLLEFNKSYNIINYYEQSKAVAVVKEDMELDYYNNKAKLAGTIAERKQLEEKLKLQQEIQFINNNIIDKKSRLGDLSFQIAIAQAKLESSFDQVTSNQIEVLKEEFEKLENEINEDISKMYTYQNTIEGIPTSKILPEWMNSVVESENLKAKLEVMDKRNKDFQEQYEVYAPAGANIKRIEREISVSEQGYLEILHGLNLAKLKLQDNELSSNLKIIDSPFFPLSPNPTKRLILVVAAGMFGGLLILGLIFVMEYFDDSLKNAKKATKIIGIPSLGMMPKILLNPGNVDLPFVQKRSIEIITQNIKHYLRKKSATETKTIVVCSTQKVEGKTVLAGNIARTLKLDGKKLVFLTFKKENNELQESRKQRKFPIITRILGYNDPRIDFDSEILADASTYLDKDELYYYDTSRTFLRSTNYQEILAENDITLPFTPEYVIIELPSLLFSNYPEEILNNSDITALVCRSNRFWTDADKSLLSTLKDLENEKIFFILNGVDLNETESILGDLPKKRSQLRKKLKAFFKLQFFSKNQI